MGLGVEGVEPFLGGAFRAEGGDVHSSVDGGLGTVIWGLWIGYVSGFLMRHFCGGCVTLWFQSELRAYVSTMLGIE